MPKEMTDDEQAQWEKDKKETQEYLKTRREADLQEMRLRMAGKLPPLSY
jgi:hypothetical protein